MDSYFSIKKWYRTKRKVSLKMSKIVYFFGIKNISFAKSRSEVIDKLEGRWMPKKKSKKNFDKKKEDVEE